MKPEGPAGCFVCVPTTSPLRPAPRGEEAPLAALAGFQQASGQETHPGFCCEGSQDCRLESSGSCAAQGPWPPRSGRASSQGVPRQRGAPGPSGNERGRALPVSYSPMLRGRWCGPRLGWEGARRGTSPRSPPPPHSKAGGDGRWKCHRHVSALSVLSDAFFCARNHSVKFHKPSCQADAAVRRQTRCLAASLPPRVNPRQRLPALPDEGTGRPRSPSL